MSVTTVVQTNSRGNRRARSKYTPPADTQTVRLSDALRGTGRFPEEKQFSLIKASKQDEERKDISIHYAGDISLLQRPCVAIVGTRQVSEAGEKRARRLARELANRGVVVVSGLAAGVDYQSHMSAIHASGHTIGVIGTPLDKAYPSENAPLQELIYKEHLLISQFDLGERTFKSSFPQRNKLMAAICDATVVIEAGESSGTLHQAAECTRLQRWLFIARSVVEDAELTWPSRFLQYDTTVPLDSVEDITSRII